MTTQQFRVHISADGVIDPIPNWTGGEREVELFVLPPEPTIDPSKILPNGKTAVEDFLQFCTGIVGNISDEELDELRYEYLTEKYR